LAVLQLNSRDVKHVPLLAYAGGTWTDLGGESIALNVKVSVREHMHAAVQESRYVVPGLRHDMGPEPRPLGNRPTFKETDLVFTCARANNELPILQSVYDQWDRVAAVKQERPSSRAPRSESAEPVCVCIQSHASTPSQHWHDRSGTTSSRSTTRSSILPASLGSRGGRRTPTSRTWRTTKPSPSHCRRARSQAKQLWWGPTFVPDVAQTLCGVAVGLRGDSGGNNGPGSD
jgi:hypothetical protein